MILIATSCAGAKVLLVRAEANADIRSAVRTTLVLVVGWSAAVANHPPVSLAELSGLTWFLMILSLVTVVTDWTVIVRQSREPIKGSSFSINQLNIGFASLFALTLLIAQPTSRTALGAFVIVAAAVLLARR